MHLLVRLACRDLQRGAARSIKLRRSHDSVTSVHPKRELVDDDFSYNFLNENLFASTANCVSRPKRDHES
jgi:hypothetical protein